MEETDEEVCRRGVAGVADIERESESLKVRFAFACVTQTIHLLSFLVERERVESVESDLPKIVP